MELRNRLADPPVKLLSGVYPSKHQETVARLNLDCDCLEVIGSAT